MLDGKETSPEPPAATARGRRLVDKIMLPFNLACEQGDLEVAQRLLRIMDIMLARQRGVASPDKELRKNRDSLVAAHERLWRLLRLRARRK